MPDVLPRDYDYEEAYQQGDLPSRRDNERRVSYALIPRRVLLDIDEERRLFFTFIYPVSEDGGEIVPLFRSGGRVRCGKHTGKILGLGLLDWSLTNLESKLYDLAVDLRKLGKSMDLPALSANFAIASRFLQRYGSEIASDIHKTIRELDSTSPVRCRSDH